MNKHLDIYTIHQYVSNRLTPEQESIVQEHISECAKCREEVRRYRALVAGMTSRDEKPAGVIKLIWKSTLFRVAASLILVAGISFAIYDSRPKALPVQSGHDSGVILSTDTYDPETYQSDTTSAECDSLPNSAPVYYTPEE